MTKENRDFIVTISILLHDYSICRDVCDFIACQFAFESDFGRSKLAVEHNNLCGMKFPLVRCSVANRISEVNIYSSYNSIFSCVLDYVLWLQYQRPLRKQLENVDLFKSLLRTYCPDKDYVNKINRIYQQFKSLQNEN